MVRICKYVKQLVWLKLDRVYLKTYAEHRKQELNRRTILESLPSNGTVTVFQTMRPEFWTPFRSQTLKKALLRLHWWPSKGHQFCFRQSMSMRAHAWTHHEMHQSAIVLVRSVPGSSLLPPPYWKARRPWGQGWKKLGNYNKCEFSNFFLFQWPKMIISVLVTWMIVRCNLDVRVVL